MEPEHFLVPDEASPVNQARKIKGRIIAVGTTSFKDARDLC